MALVQARTGSTRLPGKVLADVGGQPMLRLMLDRLRGLRVDELVVATTDGSSDDPVDEIAHGAGIACVRGPEADVLARFAIALRSHPADAVVRLTGDCPLMDSAIVNQLLQHFHQSGAHYASNTLVRTFPDGLDAEVMTADSLLIADREAKDPIEREHVTPFIYRRPERFRLAALRQDRLLGHERWTVDTEADLNRIRRAVAGLQAPADATWMEILDVLGASPTPESPLRVFRACDMPSVLALEARDCLRVGGRANEMPSLRPLLERSLDDPSVRAWVVTNADRVSGALTIVVADRSGELEACFSSEARPSLAAAGQPLQKVLNEDQQICRLVVRGRLGIEETRILHDAGYRSDGTSEVWDRHS